MPNVHTFTEKTGLIDEQDIREWFKTVDIEQARDTFRVVEGILEMRGTGRKRRKDAGRTRAATAPLYDSPDGSEGK